MVPYFPDVIQSWDVSCLNWIREHIANPVLDVFFSLVTHLGDGGIFWIICAVVMLFFQKTRKTGIMMGASLALGLILGNGLLKNLFGRVRPFDLDGAYGSMMTVDDLLVSKPGDKSFPSGHTLACFECAFVLLYRDKRFGIPALAIAVAVGFSRLYLYLHYPTDIFGGILLGLFNAVLAVIIVNAVFKAIEKKRLSVNK